MSNDFSWIDDRVDVVVPHQPAIAVYINPEGAVVVRQDGGYDDDPWITVLPEYAQQLCQAILKAAGVQPQRLALPAPAADDGPKDPTGAERQRRHRNRQRNGDDTGADGEPQ